MAIVFGSPEAQRVLERDKERIKAERDLVNRLDELRSELESIEGEMDDIGAEISNLQSSYRACERARDKLIALIEKAEQLTNDI